MESSNFPPDSIIRYIQKSCHIFFFKININENSYIAFTIEDYEAWYVFATKKALKNHIILYSLNFSVNILFHSQWRVRSFVAGVWIYGNDVPVMGKFR
ncbi:MAG: hypothetical protein D6748_13250 [Calditrichaeota bacterium]|nr:MAG: hypothetical protein D6748_13250 [Calditrichota bacterium]